MTHRAFLWGAHPGMVWGHVPFPPKKNLKKNGNHEMDFGGLGQPADYQ